MAECSSVYGKGYMDDDNDGHIWIGKNKYRILAYSYNTDSGEKRDVLRQSVYASDFVKNWFRLSWWGI